MVRFIALKQCAYRTETLSPSHKCDHYKQAQWGWGVGLIRPLDQIAVSHCADWTTNLTLDKKSDYINFKIAMV